MRLACDAGKLTRKAIRTPVDIAAVAFGHLGDHGERLIGSAYRGAAVLACVGLHACLPCPQPAIGRCQLWCFVGETAACQVQCGEFHSKSAHGGGESTGEDSDMPAFDPAEP
jgi:hypothetical protein